MKKILILIFLFNFLLGIAQQKIVSDQRYGKYLEKTIIFKIKQSAKSKCNGNTITDAKIQSVFTNISVSALKQKYPHSAQAKSGKMNVDLTTIYEINYTNDISIDKAMFRLQQNPDIEYAVPHVVVDPLYIPDDPGVASQSHLSIIKAFQAWDICKGDTNVVIAITDWGTDTGHEDLMYNVAYNFNDPINGLDDDDDGYTDNFSGWDMGAGDNNPQADANVFHGVYVSGLAAASADNHIGVAGVGFKCRFFHVKIADAQGSGIAGYESIVYAADHGASVINCSWGATYDYNSYGQDVINYATSQNCLVVSAAGNDNTEQAFYPASYEHVLSVAVLSNNDVKSGVSSYGVHVGISAPSLTYSTYPNNSYGNTYEYTSFATPIVTGCAAIVKSHYPNFNAEQIREVLKVTADNIDTVAANSSYKNLLGAGRVNLYRAVSTILPPSVIMHNFTFTDGNDNWLAPGDTARLKGLFTNYLTPSTNITATISCTSAFIQIINGTINLGVIGMMDTVNNFANPFKFKLKTNTPYDTPVRLLITFTDGESGNHTTQWVEFVARRSYADIHPNNITTTITANGNIGFNEFMQISGIGFRYKGYEPMLYDAGLMFGNSQTKVSSCVRQSNDFIIQAPVMQQLPSLVANECYTSAFNDNANPNALNVRVAQKVYAWSADSAANFIFLEYGLINSGAAPLQNIFAGIFADWDIGNSTANHVRYHAPLKFSYAFGNSLNYAYVGMKLVSAQTQNHYAIDQVVGGVDGMVDISQGFTTAQKYYVMSHTRDVAGSSMAGNDVCDVMSAGPFNIGAGDTVKVTFALLAGENLYVLENAAIEAQRKYDSIHTPNSVENVMQLNDVRVYPNPSCNQLNIVFLNKSNSLCEMIVFDATGKIQTQQQFKSENIVYDCSNLANGIYYIQIKTEKKSQTKKFVIAR